jgi:hypothetical protein
VPVETASSGNTTRIVPYPIEYFNMNTMLGPFELEPESITCSRSHTFLIYVMCSANQWENRTLMRQTWLDTERVTRLKHDGFHMERMFVLGGLEFEEPMVADAVRAESRMHRDILTLDYLQDQYVNLSRKVISAMFWINDHCNLSRVDYVMKADVDTLVNIYYIMSLAWNTQHHAAPYDYICWYLAVKVVDRSGKYEEPLETYTEINWPQYCHGPAYTSHIGVFRLMLKNIPKIPILKNEDVMMTGVCVRNKTDLNIYRIRPKRIIKEHPKKIITNRLPAMIIAHELPPSEWRAAFDTMHEDRWIKATYV